MAAVASAAFFLVVVLAAAEQEKEEHLRWRWGRWMVAMGRDWWRWVGGGLAMMRQGVAAAAPAVAAAEGEQEDLRIPLK